jgi:predicted nucleic acid-binding Zn ribbon protein
MSCGILLICYILSMPIYTYRTYPPEGSGVEPREFELEQSMAENSLVTDPESGYPVKRVFKAGHIFIANTKPEPTPRGRASCCGRGCGCH